MNQSFPYVIVVIGHASTLLIFSVILLLYGRHMKYLIYQTRNHPTMSSDIFSKKLSLLFRLNIVVTICLICYFLKGVLLGIAAYENMYDVRVYHGPIFVWFVLNSWIPTVGPVIIDC